MNRRIGVMLSYILMIFEVLSTLLLTPFIIRTLGQAEYGVYKLTFAINGYVLLLDLGIGNATIRYISKYRANNDKENEGKFFGIVTIYYFIIAIFALTIGFVITYLFPYIFSKGLTNAEIDLGQKLVFLTMLTSAITLGTSAFNNTLIAYEKFGVSKCSQIIMLTMRFIMSFSALKLGWGSLALVIINLILTIVCRLFFVIYTLFYLKIRPILKNISKKYIKEIVGYSSMILLQMIATQLNSSIDQILIGSLVTSSAAILAVYSVGSQINQYFQSIGSAFNGVLMPGVVKMVEKQANAKTLTDEMIRIGRIVVIFLALIWGVFLVEGRTFVVLWAGRTNESAYFVAVILMSAYIFYLTESVGTQILWAKNDQKELSFLKFTIVLLNIFFTVILIKWNALLGATIGTFISIFLGDIVVANIIFYKKLKINLIRYYKELLSGILPSIITVIIFGVILNNFIGVTWIGFMIKSSILVIIYFIEMLLFGFNRYEKELIYSILKIKKIKEENKMDKESTFKNKTLMITGGTGSFGHTVLKHFLTTDIGEIRIFSRDEKKQDDMRHDLQAKYPEYANKVKFYIGDVRNLQSVKDAMVGVDYIFHAAALKQVPSCEFYPMEAVKTNVIGTDNVLHAAMEEGVERVVCLSTDKAAYPINAMGTSKAMMEKVVYANARVAAQRGKTIISCTRYGNVMCSRGSVIPLFIEQIKNGRPITITNPNMTRFLMNLDEAVDLVQFAFEHANPGDLFIQKSDASTIGDLAKAVQQLFGDTGTNIIGTRHGEKLYETLMTREERLRAEDMGHYYRVSADNRDLNYDKFVVNGEVTTEANESYTSHNTKRLNVEETVQKILTTDYVREELEKMKEENK